MSSQHDNNLFSHPFLGNRVFWVALILLSMGATTAFYYQDTASLKTISSYVHRYNPPEAETPSGSLLTIYDEKAGRPRTVISLDGARVR